MRRTASLALGYEDCNDATTLRRDPVLEVCCDRDPFSDPDMVESHGRWGTLAAIVRPEPKTEAHQFEHEVVRPRAKVTISVGVTLHARLAEPAAR